MPVKIKRVYEPASRSDGYRILVDRLWPRGIKKEDAQVDKWLKDIGPSTALRKWFNHDPEKWQQFQVKYRTEIKGSEALAELQSDIHKHKTVSLLYGARDEEYNHALALLKIINADS